MFLGFFPPSALSAIQPPAKDCELVVILGIKFNVRQEPRDHIWVNVSSFLFIDCTFYTRISMISGLGERAFIYLERFFLEKDLLKL